MLALQTNIWDQLVPSTCHQPLRYDQRVEHYLQKKQKSKNRFQIKLVQSLISQPSSQQILLTVLYSISRDNHSLNAYKFSVKSYLNNVFGSLLDEALYFLEKERRNSLREESIFNITKEPINKIVHPHIYRSWKTSVQLMVL